ncbi:MAG: hypothetical protein II777_09905 [Clostridia bacterium]|nr:hypothetical protein [Clostridia bacterium]
MKKIRVLFPYVEAGFGHIMPMKSIDQTFRKKYGDKVEVVSSKFFTETGNPHLTKYEQMISKQVRIYNRNPAIGWLLSGGSDVIGSHLSSFISMRLFSPVAFKEGVKHMRELQPDVVFSTHWVSNYYAEKLEKKPLTVMYCPDATLNQLFKYHCDLSMISMPYGYQKGLRDKKLNVNNLKYVPFLIRNEAFGINRDKKALRRGLGLPEDKFTVVLAEGGYGIGKMAAICKKIVKLHVPVTVIPVCGKNEKLFNYFKTLQPTEEITFAPYMFTEKILELEAASDLFCGKSGNIIAEATFFGNPAIVTNCSTVIEWNIADHYINTVGSAMKQLDPEKTVEMIVKFAKDPALLEPYREAARKYHENFGSEKAADVLWEKITETYPELRN